MKKVLAILSCFVIILSFAACSDKNSQNAASSSSRVGETTAAEEKGSAKASSTDSEKIDVDLTSLSSTMVYSEVYNMLNEPDKYMGKTIKMNGKFSVYTDAATKKNYYAVIIADAAACCQQGLEFDWKGSHSYPDDFPQIDSQIEVVGTFDTYTENGQTYAVIRSDDGAKTL